MLAYFPAIYPDELLYSVIARYHHHVGNGSPKETVAELFGHRTARITPFQAGRLDELARRLPADRGLTPERLALSTTFYPYCVAYEPASVRRTALHAMIVDDTEADLATVASQDSPVRFSKTLKCCRRCTAEALERFGEPYWRRAHQLPGVLVCPAHGLPLITAARVPTSATEHRHLILPPATVDFGKSPPAWMSDGDSVALLWDIARRCTRLLESMPPSGMPRSRLNALRERGLVKEPAWVDRRRLCEAYVAFARPIRPALKEARSTRWLLAMIHPARLSAHPLHQVLFDLLLESLPRRPQRSASNVGREADRSCPTAWCSCG